MIFVLIGGWTIVGLCVGYLVGWHGGDVTRRELLRERNSVAVGEAFALDELAAVEGVRDALAVERNRYRIALRAIRAWAFGPETNYRDLLVFTVAIADSTLKEFEE